MSTRAELRAMVLSNLAGRTDKNTEVNFALEFGLQQAVDLYLFKSLVSETDISLTENDKYVSLPSNTFQLVEARLINGTLSYALTIKSKSWLVRKWANISASSTGKPVYCYVEDNKLYLFPISNGEYTIRVTACAKPTFNGEDATNNPIPTLDNALVCYATAYIMDNLQMFDYGAVWNAKWKEALNVARSGDKSSPEVYKAEPFGLKKEDIVEPYLNPFAGFER